MGGIGRWEMPTRVSIVAIYSKILAFWSSRRLRYFAYVMASAALVGLNIFEVDVPMSGERELMQRMHKSKLTSPPKYESVRKAWHRLTNKNGLGWKNSNTLTLDPELTTVARVFAATPA